MSVEWRGNPQATSQMRWAITQGVNAYLLVIERALKVQLGKPGTGRIYRIGKGRKGAKTMRKQGLHQASAPGQPPAVNTGTLRRSWQIGGPTGAKVRKYSTPDRIGMQLGSPVRYARIEGNFGRVRARPYIKPTIEAVRDLFEPTMARAMRRVARLG